MWVEVISGVGWVSRMLVHGLVQILSSFAIVVEYQYITITM